MKNAAFLLVCLLFAIPCQARIIYVDANTPDNNDGSSWAKAYKYLQDALSDAESSGDVNEIRVAQGIYKPDQNSADPNGSGDREATFQLVNSVVLRGGYAGFSEADPNVRDFELYETILNGDISTPDVNTDNSYHVVTGSGVDANAIIGGFTITAGNADWSEGGGMFNNSGSPTVTNCVFINNSAILGGGMCNLNNSNPMLSNCSFSGNVTPPWGEGSGGNGMFNDQSDPTLIDCIFYANSGGSYGGGIFNTDSSPTLTNCDFEDNTGYRFGGAIANYTNSNPKLTNCTFSGGSSRIGGGMYNNDNSSPTLTNCVFVGNSAEWGGGGMRNYQSNPTLTNCVFVGNTGNTYDGGGIHNQSSSSTLRNCIFWGNTDNGGTDESAQIHNGSGGSADVSYCCIQGLSVFAGSGNIDADPCFVDANGPDGEIGTEDDNLRLSPGSPCIDAGDNISVPNDIADLDNDGNTAERTPLDLDYGQRFADDPCTVDSGVPDPPAYPYVVDMGAYEYRYYSNTCWDPLECAGQPFGDASCDGCVCLDDLAALKAAWGMSSPYANPYCCADFTQDGQVNLDDLAALKASWGSYYHIPSTGIQSCPP
ncbi:MAG: hypothetical protein ACYS83_02310 [Planctomycetota bacterium]|jgi:hypothetical protein